VYTVLYRGVTVHKMYTVDYRGVTVHNVHNKGASLVRSSAVPWAHSPIVGPVIEPDDCEMASARATWLQALVYSVYLGRVVQFQVHNKLILQIDFFKMQRRFRDLCLFFC